MSKNHHADGRDDARAAVHPHMPDGRSGVETSSEDPAGPSRLLVRVIERVVIVRFVNSEMLFEEAAVRAVREQLSRLISEEGHTRLLLNFRGVRYLSATVLGILIGLKKKVDPARGCIQLCGLEPLLRDMLRITHLDSVFDVYTDEAEALGLILH